MGEWFQALILGLIQGLTEFLPISSDGHLALFQILSNGWLAESQTGSAHVFFDVMLHLGTTAAIMLNYRNQVGAGVRGFLGREDVAEGYRRPALVRLALLTFVGMLPLLPVLLLRKRIAELFESLPAVGVGFLVTAAVLLITLRLGGGKKGPREMTWLDALLIGAAQAFAPLPGVSRSGLTVAMALARGFTKTWAVGFSLMLAVPTILGAAVLELREADLAAITPERAAQIVVATLISGVVGYAAILWLLRVVRSGRLWYFSVYLIVLGVFILGYLVPRASRTHELDAGAYSVGHSARRDAGSGAAGLVPRVGPVAGALSGSDIGGARLVAHRPGEA